MGRSNTMHELVCESCGVTHYSLTTNKRRCDGCNPRNVKRRGPRGKYKPRELHSHYCRTVQEVAEHLGVTPQHVRHLEKEALAKLRRSPLLQAYYLERIDDGFYF